MPGLVRAEEVAGPADLQVAHGDLEAGAQLGVLADRPQPLVGLFGEDAVGRMEEVGVGPLSPAAHPATDLVQLAEPEEVGTIHDQAC